jgi:hypothetical protein
MEQHDGSRIQKGPKAPKVIGYGFERVQAINMQQINSLRDLLTCLLKGHS